MRRNTRVSLIWDKHEGRKLQIFDILCQLAKDRGISIIHVWRTREDYGEVDDLIFQSSGPIGDPNTCVFCGESLFGHHPIKIGEFSCDGGCYLESLIEVQGFTYLLHLTEHRPPIIVVDASMPGSLNNIVFRLAYGLGFYRRSLRRPTADSSWLATTAEDFAWRLVSWIEKKLPPSAD